MPNLHEDKSTHFLHKDLWIYSVWIFLWSWVTIINKDIIWLSIAALLGCIFWISRYFIHNKQYSFPYGPANAITILRICLLITVSVMHPILPSTGLGLVLIVICLGDILDGYIARALKMTSTIGEYLDKETDALFVLFVSLLLYLRGYTGLWIIGLGMIRYVYFVIFFFFIVPGRKEHKDPYARIIAVFLFISLMAAFIIPKSLSLPLIMVASILLVYSFTRGALFETGFLK